MKSVKSKQSTGSSQASQQSSKCSSGRSFASTRETTYISRDNPSIYSQRSQQERQMRSFAQSESPNTLSSSSQSSVVSSVQAFAGSNYISRQACNELIYSRRHQIVFKQTDTNIADELFLYSSHKSTAKLSSSSESSVVALVQALAGSNSISRQAGNDLIYSQRPQVESHMGFKQTDIIAHEIFLLSRGRSTTKLPRSIQTALASKVEAFSGNRVTLRQKELPRELQDASCQISNESSRLFGELTGVSPFEDFIPPF